MDLLDFVTEYWHILVGVTTLIYLWVQNVMINKDQEKRIARLEVKMEEISPVLIDIRERLISIETTLKLHIHDDTH